MNEMRALRTFLLAIEKRNFALVARELMTTPASVTRTIAALETELGVQLFVRTTRQVSPTAEGAAFAARIEPALQTLEAARVELLNAHKADEGRLRINAPMSFGQRVLAKLLCSFSGIYPKIDVQISLTDQLLDMVSDEFDLAIRISETPSNKFTIWRKICPIDRVLAVAPEHAHASVGHPSELPLDVCLGYDCESRREIWHLTNGDTSVAVTAGRAISSNNGEVLARMAVEGAGVVLLPEFILAEYLADGRLVRVLPEWKPPQFWLTLYYPPYQQLPPRIASFSDFFEAEIPAYVTAIT
ncbi:LysR family transcriptional regulator [Aureimonas altamirensis]|uniref:LysR family transcriptional regulator n=1 Tax=Aureimonas altamirensis TaxID=370622 RepID=A0A0B1PZT3_9HYPH|nr:LysR family transcriptional regulator [Aureimonas altamirensis]KHJ54048.1 LysR family transcriptional regulator [Aureimonas altamirensis]